MASLKEVKNRINSVKSTRQITSAMKMVASAKLHKAQGRIESMYPYQQKLNEILTNFLGTDITVESPYIEVRPVTKVAIVAFSSNSSLCGAFNSNVVKMLEHTLEEYSTLGKDNILLFPVGKKVEEAVKKLGYTPQGTYQSMADKPCYTEAYQLAEQLLALYAEKAIDCVILIYHHFKSMGSQVLQQEDYLPLDLEQMAMQVAMYPDKKEMATYNNDYIVEPSVSELIAELLPKVLCQKIFTVLQDSNASEHAARMLAMQAATDNANELIQDLTLQYNKTRQQTITNELLDIIGGSLR
ncbi:F0F1 ATP synthase subunit gamma [Caecibacteroides pullorum]|uniref:ATP synthase gamma chain n=1 Tax=Caecibacteroides pullorum TaxID=2725562 RepID=A0AA40ZRU1_9BACT|nr:F0F1 ATP synthase subunit gamma [Caecibacteroides pullorum]MBM6856798.1 F0F1 ATP synthase subunit gamma [Caecibacteroides pullorum]MBV8057805.1 F0F1 ATP synthase subunit gamma [Caecibacteroides pullorum]